jgi:hypothetical protein
MTTTNPPSDPAELMDRLDTRLRTDPQLTEGVTAVYEFVVEGTDGGRWRLEAGDGSGSVRQGAPTDADVTIRLTDEVLMRIGTQQLDGAQAYFDGLIVVEGDQSKAAFLDQIFGG